MSINYPKNHNSLFETARSMATIDLDAVGLAGSPLYLSCGPTGQLSIPHSKKKILLDVFGCIRNPHLIFFLGRIGMYQVEASFVIVVGNTKDWKGKWL